MVGRVAMKMEKDVHQGSWDAAMKDYAEMGKVLK
jgi:hypothetical protein